MQNTCLGKTCRDYPRGGYLTFMGGKPQYVRVSPKSTNMVKVFIINDIDPFLHFFLKLIMEIIFQLPCKETPALLFDPLIPRRQPREEHPQKLARLQKKEQASLDHRSPETYFFRAINSPCRVESGKPHGLLSADVATSVNMEVGASPAAPEAEKEMV